MKLELAMTLDQQRARPKKYQTAGQPKKANKKVSITIRIEPELLKKLTAHLIFNSDKSRSAFIEAAIVDRLNR